MKPTALIYEATSQTNASSRKLLGLTLLKRLTLSLERDGAIEVLPISQADQVQPGPVVLVPSTLAGTPKALKALLSDSARPHSLHIAGGAVIRVDSINDLPQAAFEDTASWIVNNGPKAQPPADVLVNVVDKKSAKIAEDALIQSLRKNEDGLISRTLNRPVSLYTTRWLARTAITPNQWTIFTAFVGLLGLALMVQGGYWNLVFGAFLIHLSSVWDGCDGELARLKFHYSKLGEWLDTICDDVVNSCLFLGLGFGVAATTGQSFYAVLGTAAVMLNMANAAVVYYFLINTARSGYALDFKFWFEADQKTPNTVGTDANFMNKLKFLVRRDCFIFVFFVMTALGLPHVAMWLAFIGVIPTFLLGFMQSVVVPIRRRRYANRASMLSDAE